jgi:hypothetical protein
VPHPLPPCLSIQQPWAWLITSAGKDIENRTWQTAFRGWFLIHAPARVDSVAIAALRGLRRRVPSVTEAQVGGIVGAAEVIDCVSESDSQWFAGPFGIALRNARPIPFVPMAGRLSFFPVPSESGEAVREALRLGHLAGF